MRTSTLFITLTATIATAATASAQTMTEFNMNTVQVVEAHLDYTDAGGNEFRAEFSVHPIQDGTGTVLTELRIGRKGGQTVKEVRLSAKSSAGTLAAPIQLLSGAKGSGCAPITGLEQEVDGDATAVEFEYNALVRAYVLALGGITGDADGQSQLLQTASTCGFGEPFGGAISASAVKTTLGPRGRNVALRIESDDGTRFMRVEMSPVKNGATKASFFIEERNRVTGATKATGTVTATDDVLWNAPELVLATEVLGPIDTRVSGFKVEGGVTLVPTVAMARALAAAEVTALAGLNLDQAQYQQSLSIVGGFFNTCRDCIQ